MNTELNFMLKEYERVKTDAYHTQDTLSKVAKINGELIAALAKVLRANTLGATHRIAHKALRDVPTLVDKLPL